MENRTVALCAPKSERPDRMCLVLEVLYVHLLRRRLVEERYVGDHGAIDQSYDTAYRGNAAVVKTACVCRRTHELFKEYVASEQKRILCSGICWVHGIDRATHLCDPDAYVSYFTSNKSGEDFSPMEAWMPAFSYVRHTLSYNGVTFGTLDVTRMTRRKRKRDKDTCHFLVARLTVSTSDGQHVALEPLVVDVDDICWEEPASDSEDEQDGRPAQLQQYMRKLYRDIMRFVRGQARGLFECS